MFYFTAGMVIGYIVAITIYRLYLKKIAAETEAETAITTDLGKDRLGNDTPLRTRQHYADYLYTNNRTYIIYRQ